MSSQIQQNMFLCVSLFRCRCVWMQVCVDILLLGRWTFLWRLTDGVRMEEGSDGGGGGLEGGSSVFDSTANLSLLDPGDSGDHATSHYSESTPPTPPSLLSSVCPYLLYIFFMHVQMNHFFLSLDVFTHSEHVPILQFSQRMKTIDSNKNSHGKSEL